MTRPGIEPRSPGPLANTLTAGPSIEVYIKKSKERQSVAAGKNTDIITTNRTTTKTSKH